MVADRRIAPGETQSETDPDRQVSYDGNMTVVSLDTPTPGQCTTATLSPLEPIVVSGTVEGMTDGGTGFGIRIGV